MNRKIKQRGGRLTRKLICSVAAVVMLVGLSVFAAASLTDEKACPNHTEHDETCGYVEATDSQAGHPCEHICAVCDPALELEEKKDTYDKYAESEQHKEKNIIYKKNHDSLQDLQTYVYNEEGARGKDEQGEWMKVSLTKDVDYTVSAVPTNEEYEQITFKNSYLDSLYQLPYTYLLQFESGNPQEYELTIGDTTPEEVPEDETTTVPTPEEPQVDGTQEEPEGETSVERGASKVGGYEITMSSNTMEENDTTYRYTNAESNGTLTLNLNLQTSGEKERYVIIQMPEYGMILGNSLPGAGQGITKVTKQNERTLRLDIDDNVDESLNVGIAYVRKPMTNAMELAWRQGTVPSATGFTVTIFGKMDNQNKELATKTYGNWKVDTSGTASNLGSNMTQKMVKKLNPIHWPYDLEISLHTPERGFEFELKPGEGRYAAPGFENLQAEYIKGFKFYADQVILEKLFVRLYLDSSIGNSVYEKNPQIQTDDKGSYIEFVLKNNQIGASNISTMGGSGWMRFAWQQNPEIMGMLTPGEVHKVQYVAVVGKYTPEGIEEEERAYDMADLTVRDAGTKDFFSPSYASSQDFYNQNYDDPKSKSFRLIKGEEQSFKFAGFTNAGYSDGEIEYSPEDYYEGLTEEYEFPYELQPKQMSYIYGDNYVCSEYGEIKEMTYQLSDGTTKTVTVRSEQVGDKRYRWVADFEVPEGQRVTKVKVVWDKYYQFIRSIGEKPGWLGEPIWNITANVMETKEDGSEIDNDYSARVQHTVKRENGTVLAKSTEKELCLYFQERLITCPTAQWHSDSYNYFQYDILYANDRSKTLDKGEIRVGRELGFAAPKYALRDKLENPKLAIRWMEPPTGTATTPILNLDGTPEELAGYLYTGKMKVYSKLAGWTVTYRTRGKGEQTITLPEEIPDTGYDMVLPVDEGDRLVGFPYTSGVGYSIVEFSKEGVVPGWAAAEGSKLVSDVEIMYPKNKDDGTSLDKDGVETGLYGVARGDALLTSDSCALDEVYSGSKKNHTHTGPTAQQKPFAIMELRDMKLVMNKLTASGGAKDGIYQDASAEVNVGGKIQVKRTDQKKYGGFNGTPSPSGRFSDINMPMAGLEKEYWKETKPVVYAKLIHPNVTWMGEEGTIQMKAIMTLSNGTPGSSPYKTYEVPADITIIADENGGNWLKFEAQQSVKIPIHQGNNTIGTVLDIQGKTSLYAFPGATLGSGQKVIGDVYIDEQFDEWEAAYQGKDEQHNTLLEVQDRVADELNLRETGDVTTPTLYKYEDGVKMNILQKVLVGIRVIPGISSSYAMDTREKEFYPNKQNSLTSMMTISSDNDDLKNHTTVLELPEKGKEVLGKVFGAGSGEGDVKRTSEFTAGLRSGVTVESNSASVTPTYRYRINGTWYTQDQMESSNNWNAVQAVEVTVPIIPKNTSITFGLKLRAEDKIDLADWKGYIGGTFNYGSAGGSSSGTLTFANYIYHPYIIGGNVFKDTDESGLKNGSEKGLKDITVNLMSKSSEDPIATVTTDANGNYKIPSIEYRNLYLMITMPDGSKLTKQSENPADASDKDSDFERETNLYMGLPDRLGEGTYDISAGIINLPTIDAPDVTVRMEEPVNTSVTATWEKANPTIQFEQAADTTIATVDSITEGNSGKITPVAVGSTTAVAWVENSLGDRVEKTYTITVVPREVAISLTKGLTNVADSDLAFVFKIEKLSDADGSVEQTFYQTLKIQQGNSSASVVIRKLYPGTYRFTEIESNWRYGVVGTVAQEVVATVPDTITPVQFINQLNNELWSSANAVVTNNMQESTP